MIKSYDEMSVGIFYEVKEILMDNTITEFEKKVRLLSILNDTTDDVIMDKPLTEVGKMAEEMGFLAVPPQKVVVPSQIVLNGKKYNIQYDIKNITTSQYIDFQTFIKDYEKYMVELASIVVIPEGKKYNDGYDIIEVQNDIRDYMSIVQLSSICFFFVKMYQGLMESLTSYSIRGLKKMMRKEKDRVKKIKIGRVIVEMKHLIQEIRRNG